MSFLPRAAGTTSAARDRSSAFSFPAASPSGPCSPRSPSFSVDDRISDSEAACLQSLSDSVAAVETAGIAIGDSVAIYGQGSMGLECLQIARTSGAGLIVTVDVRDEACRVSRELGADVALNARDADPVASIRDLTGGNGADIVFECAGGSPKQGLAGTRSLHQAIESVRSGGKLVGVSWFGAPMELDVDFLRERSLRFLFPDISTLAHLEHTVRLVASGRVRLKPTITHVLHGLESVPQAFEITANKAKVPGDQPRAGGSMIVRRSQPRTPATRSGACATSRRSSGSRASPPGSAGCSTAWTCTSTSWWRRRSSPSWSVSPTRGTKSSAGTARGSRPRSWSAGRSAAVSSGASATASAAAGRCA